MSNSNLLFGFTINEINTMRGAAAHILPDAIAKGYEGETLEAIKIAAIGYAAQQMHMMRRDVELQHKLDMSEAGAGGGKVAGFTMKEFLERFEPPVRGGYVLVQVHDDGINHHFGASLLASERIKKCMDMMLKAVDLASAFCAANLPADPLPTKEKVN